MRWFLREVKGKLLLVDWVLRLDIVLCLTHWTPLFMLSSSFHLKDMDVSIANVTPLNCDNQSAIQIAHNLVFYEQKKKRTKIDCHFIYHHLLHGILYLWCFAFEDQPTNIFTKSLVLSHFCRFLSKLKLIFDLSPWVWRMLDISNLNRPKRVVKTIYVIVG